jgi:hypothetical protein
VKKVRTSFRRAPWHRDPFTNLYLPLPGFYRIQNEKGFQ